MRATLTILATVAAMSVAAANSARAQYAAPPMAGPHGGQAAGYWVPVLVTDHETPASYSLGDGAPPRPEVDSSGCDHGGGCDCAGGCDSRGGNCGCFSCRGGSFTDRVFGSVEYMSWYNQGTFLPPLVTTSPSTTPQATAGVLPGASILFGNDEYDNDRKSGGRLTVGYWLDDCQERALGAKFYGVEGDSVTFTRNSAGIPILARPFFNADPLVNAEDALLVAFPGLSSGNVNMRAENDVFGVELFFRSMLDQGRDYRLDFIGGWQFNRVDSDLVMYSASVAGANTFIFNDVFDVENEYNAGTAGLYGELYHDLWTFSALGKIGMGNMQQRVAISGSNTVIAGGTVTTPGGLFTQPTNIGTYERDTFTFAPEVNFKASYAITRQLSVTVGYTFLYWTDMAFAGDQIDRAVNGTQLVGGALVGPARPTFNFNDSDFWVQTVDVGVSWNY